jgi:hypothetical protein
MRSKNVALKRESGTKSLSNVQSGSPDLGFPLEHPSHGGGSCKNDAFDKENDAKRRHHRSPRFSPAATHIHTRH